MPPVPPRPDDADNVTPPPPTDAAPAPTPVEPAVAPKYLKPSARSVVVMVVVALLGIALILRAWHLWPFTSSVMVTDNAYVRGQITVMAPQVNGYVTEVLVKDFQHVTQGEPLLRIDDRIYAQRVAQAQATLDSARAALANSDQSQAQNRAQIASARATLSAGQAELQRSRNETKRYEELAAQQLVSINDRDKFRTAQASAQASVQQSQAQIRIAEETLVSTQVARKSLEAQVESAQAQLELARIDLANTVIHAPRDGQISEASVRVGQYVAAGSQLLFLVPDTLWVVANYKEGQTWGMAIGQPATFSVDAFQGQVLRGRVQEIAPATGSEFSVLRPDNASGNFTKVVQRLPVRISINRDQKLAKQLRPGMSVIVRVDTHAGPVAPFPKCRPAAGTTVALAGAARAEAMHFQGLRLRLETQLLGALLQLGDDLAVLQLHCAVAAVADQERHRMRGTAGVMAGHEGIDRFQLVHEPVGHQEVQRAVHGGRGIRAHALAVAHPFQQLVGLDRLAGLGDQLQHIGADRGQAQPAFARDALDHRHEIRCVVDVVVRGGTGNGGLGGHACSPVRAWQGCLRPLLPW